MALPRKNAPANLVRELNIASKPLERFLLLITELSVSHRFIGLGFVDRACHVTLYDRDILLTKAKKPTQMLQPIGLPRIQAMVFDAVPQEVTAEAAPLVFKIFQHPDSVTRGNFINLLHRNVFDPFGLRQKVVHFDQAIDLRLSSKKAKKKGRPL